MSYSPDGESESSGLPQGVSWRGKRASEASEVTRGWQGGTTPQPLVELRLRDRRRRVRFAMLLMALLGLFGLWMYGLLFTAVQTPVVGLVATDYEWPLPPNAWAREDFRGLTELHLRTLNVAEVSSGWSSAEQGLRDFERKLKVQCRRRSGLHTLIVYVSLHGFVNAAGEPCLLPPGASPRDSSTWLPVRDLLAAIKAQALPDTWHKLLILDSGRLQTEWQLGVLDNTFADHLPQAVREAGIPQLIVLNSTSPGQTGWASAELQGSVFGHYLRQALQGEADADGNRRISVGELVDYLRREVNHWALTNRADRQEPLLIGEEEARRQEIVWVPRGKLPPPTAVESPVKIEELRDLWWTHDRLAALQPQRFDPLGWCDLEHRLLWLEQLAAGGGAYGQKAVDVRDDLKRRLAAIQRREGGGPDVAPVVRLRNIWSDDHEALSERLVLHTLPLARFFGTVKTPLAEQVHDQWNRFGQMPREPVLAEVLTQLEQLAKPQQLAPLAESAFLRLLQRYRLAQEPSAGTPHTAVLGTLWATLQRGEQTAVPEDERVSDWVRSLIAMADTHRRAAEDALLDGDEQAALAETRLADDKYSEAGKLAETIAVGLQVRDAAYADVPYLAQWLCRPLPVDQSSAAADLEVNQTLLRLIGNLHRWGEQLGRHDQATGEAEATRLAKSQREVAQDLARLQDQFRTHCAALEKSRETGPDQFREIAAVLATPLLPAEARLTLLQKLVKLDAALNQASPAGAAPGAKTAPAVATPTQPEEPPLDYRTRMETRWTSHPAWQLLNPDWLDLPPLEPMTDEALATHAAGDPSRDSATGPAADTARPGKLALAQQRLGQRLRELPRRLTDLTEQKPAASAAAAADGAALAREQAHLRRSQTERLARAAASLWGQLGDRNPVAELRRFDLQQLLLWHCQRTLDDFRGPASPRDEPFFSLAAADYLGPSGLFQELDPALAQERESLRALLAAGQNAARHGLSLAVENVLLLDPSDVCRTNVAISPAVGLETGALPQGRMAFLVLHAGQRVNGLTLSRPTPAPGSEAGTAVALRFPPADRQELQLTGAPLAQSGPDLQAAAVFRGHEFTTRFLVQTLGGVTVDYVPSANPPTRITLQGIRRQRRSIVFILDCSDSMQEETPVEATEGRTLPRLEIAKSALQGMLDQLAAQGETRVGVRLFGHRVGWSTTEPVRVLRQTTYARPIPPDLSPGEDVELILPLGRFDSVMAGQVAALLRTVRPWGQTPLYRSLVEALQDFEADEADTDKHVVVISDGMNYQFTPSASGQFTVPNPTTMDDVVAAWGKLQPALHIVGFGIPEKEQAAAEQAYRELVARTKGEFETSAVEAQALLRKLDGLLAKSTYRVRNASDQDAGAPLEQDGTVSPRRGPAHLGESLIVTPPPSGLQTYDVRCQTTHTSLGLRGGENVVLELSDDGRRIDGVAYLEGSPRFGRLTDGRLGTSTGFTVGAHRPIAEQGGVRFLVSLQHEQRRFVPRPAEIWIELIPVTPDGRPAGARYTFYDAEFDPQTPVPALRWLAKGWPAQAQQASVRFWCKAEATAPEVTVPLSQLKAAPADRQTFPALPGIALQLETVQRQEAIGVRVVEWHGADSEGVGSLRVQLAGPAGTRLRPQRVVHLFDAEQRVAAHVFFVADLKAFAATGWEIQLTKASAVRSDAQQLDKPLEVGITETVELLAPTSSTTP